LALAAAALALAGCRRAPPPPGGALRLVSTAPNLTEILFAIGAGDCLAGRTDVCDYPPEAARVPITGGFANPWLEPLLAAHPTHVLECALENPALEQHLAAHNIPLVHIPCARLRDIPGAILQLGALTGRQAQAQALAERIRAHVSTPGPQPPAPPSVLLLLAPDTPITAGADTFVSELLTLAGGANAAAHAAGYHRVSLEWLLARNPDIILCLFDPQGQDPAALFAARTGWKALTAVREGRVKAVPGLDTVLRPGPRVLDGLEQLRSVMRDERHN